MKNRAGASLTLALLTLMPFAVAPAVETGLGGSMSSMRRQYQVAKQSDFTFLRTAAQVREFVREDRLVHIASNADLLVHNVSFPYARPIVKLFVERLAQQYREATGEQLVVTSLTRPMANQPRNAHQLSVHPTGMAVDLRIPRNAASRAWLERTLLELEGRQLLDATRERRPPHYHIAVFPDRYSTYVEGLMEREASRAAGMEVAEAPSANAPASLDPSAASDSSHDHGDAEEIGAVGPTARAASLPIAASLGIAVVGIAGFIRRRVRRGREERRSRAR